MSLLPAKNLLDWLVVEAGENEVKDNLIKHAGDAEAGTGGDEVGITVGGDFVA